MNTIQTLLLIMQVIVAVCLIGFILIQHGKGADAGAAFGSGASSTVFGARGSGNFLTRATTFLAILFLGNSLLLGYLATENIRQQSSLMDQETDIVIEKEISKETAPVQDAPASDIPALPEQQQQP
ncbi:MAG: preprotein translocase subunit SecG [Gammaproteobacteria bacterium]|nr:preprotein translocase subunit SecG [Gammaproteobacteria bacterium]